MWGGAAPAAVMANSTVPEVPMVGSLVADGRYEVKMMGWNTPAEYMAYVHPHWKSYEAPNPAYHYMLGLLYTFLCVASLLGNGCVIWIFTTAKSLQTPSNMLIINLAMMDFIMMLKTPVFIVSSFNEGPVWGKFGCDVYGLMGAFTGPGAAITNAVIAYDRYKVIARPFDPKMTRLTAFALVLFTWVYALPWALLPYLEVWGKFVPEGFLTTCTFDYLTETDEIRAFVATIFFFCFCIPAALITFFYGQIFGQVTGHEKAMKEQANRMHVEGPRGVSSKEEQERSDECRIAKVTMGIFFLFVISWFPYAIVALTACFGDRTYLTPVVAMIPACTCKAAACIDPWVYAINHPKYRLELQKRMPWFCIHEEKPLEAASQTTEKPCA